MDRDALRALQAPLKERYREEPEAALVTLSATGTLDDGVARSVETGRAIAIAGLHPATGGDGALLCSGDMLLEASSPAPASRIERSPLRSRSRSLAWIARRRSPFRARRLSRACRARRR
jgi:hypothetical protein